MLPHGLYNIMKTKFEVPTNLDASDWKCIEPYAAELKEREIRALEQLEAWLFDRSKLIATIIECGSNLFNASNRNTADLEAKSNYEAFTENIEPKWRELEQALDKMLVDSPFAAELSDERYLALLRSAKSNTKIYREENLPLFVEDRKMQSEYFKTLGNMTVGFDGEELPIPQLMKQLLETDRSLRERAWHAMRERRLQDAQDIESLYNKMVPLRHNLARNADLSNYVEFAFREKKRFDYTPADCQQLHESVEKYVVPLAREFTQKKKELLEIDSVRPWDQAVDELNREPLKPFESIDELLDKAYHIFRDIDEELGSLFLELRDGDCLDLDSRKNKALIGYQNMRPVIGKPFIFMNAVGRDHNLRTLIHEAGHAFHSMLCREDPIIEYTHAPTEFCEVASMSMELLVYPHLNAFYNEADANRSRRTHLKGCVNALTLICWNDAFQHWVYSNPSASAAERENAWVDQFNRFNTSIDFSGYEEYLRKSWFYTNHPFTTPMYMIEYAIAQLGAFQLWLISLDDTEKAISGYKRALRLGGSRPLPELFAAAGIEFDFSPGIVKKLVDRIKSELDKMEG